MAELKKLEETARQFQSEVISMRLVTLSPQNIIKKSKTLIFNLLIAIE